MTTTTRTETAAFLRHRWERAMSTNDEQQWEYGFESPQTGVFYATTNDMLAEVMHAARPDATLLRRPFVEWEPAPIDRSADA